jgi:bifunctional DNA-binding transcriptional regulator/antitoxin component of YhaV-PrlF toxin-antitoxin module
MHRSIALEPESARLRQRNQLTLPASVAARLDVKPGDRFLVVVDGPDTIRLVRIRESYAGALAGLWGATPAEMAGWLHTERASWSRRPDLGEPGGDSERP